MPLSLFARLFRRSPNRDRGEHGLLVGDWNVVDIAAPHPFGSYVLTLRADGSHAWVAKMPTKEGAEVEVRGSGTWRITKDCFEYTSGDASRVLRYVLEDPETLVFDRLPATKIGPAVRCV